jgi:hypothetical protein
MRPWRQGEFALGTNPGKTKRLIERAGQIPAIPV